METIKLDERGRLTLPKEIRQDFKEKEFRVVRAGHMILLHPVAKEPIKHWREAWKGAKFKSLQEEKLSTREIMRKEIEGA